MACTPLVGHGADLVSFQQVEGVTECRVLVVVWNVTRLLYDAAHELESLECDIDFLNHVVPQSSYVYEIQPHSTSM